MLLRLSDDGKRCRRHDISRTQAIMLMIVAKDGLTAALMTFPRCPAIIHPHIANRAPNEGRPQRPIIMRIKIGTIAELVVNLFLPWLVYRLTLPALGSLGALYASAAPPLAWSLIEFAKVRRVDALSVIVLLGIGLSIATMAIGGSARILLVRESLVSGLIGVAFLLSLLLERPIVYYLARATIARQEANGVGRFERVWNERPLLRANLRMMTATWGAALTAEMLLRCWLAWHWPVERSLVVLPIISYAIYGALMVWTLWMQKRMRARENAVQQSAEQSSHLREAP